MCGTLGLAPRVCKGLSQPQHSNEARALTAYRPCANTWSFVRPCSVCFSTNLPVEGRAQRAEGTATHDQAFPHPGLPNRYKRREQQHRRRVRAACRHCCWITRGLPTCGGFEKGWFPAGVTGKPKTAEYPKSHCRVDLVSWLPGCCGPACSWSGPSCHQVSQGGTVTTCACV